MVPLIHKLQDKGSYRNKNLQKKSFKNEDLSNADFSGCDLRGADFSGANCTNANFTNVKTGLTPLTTVVIFFAALIVSILSGYFAMLTGRIIQIMLASPDPNIRAAGIVSIAMIILFIGYAWWKGGRNAIVHLILPAAGLALITGIIAYVSGWGTGMGMLYLLHTFFFLIIMFVVGTIARTAAGSLSNLLFLLVAISGAMFGKSIGGGIAATIMAIACALISKRALSGAGGYKFLQKIASSVTSGFGTSFRNVNLSNANFSHSKICNADFTNAIVSSVNWFDAKKINCITDDYGFVAKQ